MKDHQSNRGERWSWILLLTLSVLAAYKAGQRSIIGSLSVQPDARVHVDQQLCPDTQQSSKKPSKQPDQSIGEAGSTSILSSAPMKSLPPARPLTCPPCDCEPAPSPPRKKAKRAPPPQPISPIDRQRLLAWVKRHSDRLKRCRDAGQPIYRLNARVQLNAKRSKILKVVVKGSQLPSKALKCVEQDIKRWPPPDRLSPTHPSLLIFGLQLD